MLGFISKLNNSKNTIITETPTVCSHPLKIDMMLVALFKEYWNSKSSLISYNNKFLIIYYKYTCDCIWFKIVDFTRLYEIFFDALKAMDVMYQKISPFAGLAFNIFIAFFYTNSDS